MIKVVDDYNDYDTMREDSGLDILFENEKWVVFIPKTFEASNKWGSGRFCTSNDEDDFKYHNINNNSLVYVMHKFDYTKNIVIECFPNRQYQIWNYQDDNTFGGEGKVYQELSDIDDGYLNVDKILYNLPDVDDDFTITQTDLDNDGIPNDEDICPTDHNPLQEDSYPPQGNFCGEICECEGNFNGDDNVDGTDAFTFKQDFGRNQYNDPCSISEQCNGNFNCDEDVDGDDAFTFKEDFGRNQYNNPCPSCPTDPWCTTYQ